MFKPKVMSKVELVVPERAVVPVTEALASSGVFHLTTTEHMCIESTSGPTSEWHTWSTTFATLERRILAVMEALGVDKGPAPEETPHLVLPEVAQMDVERLEQEAQAPVQDLEEERHRLAQLQLYISQLRPIVDLQVDLGDLRTMRYLLVMLGTMPIANTERLRTSLEHIPFVLVTLRREEHLATVVLFGVQRDAEILNRAARSAYLNPLTPPETYRGTPAEAIAALEASIERTDQHIVEYTDRIERLRELRIHHLRHLLWRVRASRTLAETISRYGRLRYTYLVAGWVPASLVPTLKDSIARVSDQVLVEVSAPRREDNGHIPVALDNPPLVRAFQGLVTTYGQPRYGELDPTPMIALTFPLIFGIMFGDVGHGLLLVLLGLLLASRKVRALHSLASLGAILVACGLMAVLFGFLYGSIFGFEEVLQPLWIRPLDDIMSILLTTVGLGVVLLSLGMILNIVNAALSRQWGRMLVDHNGLAGLAFYWSLVGLAASTLTDHAPVKPALLAVSAILFGLVVTLSEVLERFIEGHRPLIEGSISTYLVQLPIEVFETVIGLLSNTLSYVRMGAFAVAHSSLSLVVFILARMVSPSHNPGYWIVVILGNLFVIGFEGMIVAIQTLRLEYYEFFSKFFSGGGVRHSPLTLISRGED